MFGLLLALLLLIGIFMTVIVLLQSGKGGGLAAMGGASSGSDNLIGGRQAATLLTKATWVSGGLFLFLSLTLSVLSSRQTTPDSILRGQFQEAPAAPPLQPFMPGVEPGQPVQPPGGDAAEPAPLQLPTGTPPASTTGQ